MLEGREISYEDLQPEEDANKARDYLKRRRQNQTLPQEAASILHDIRLEKRAQPIEISPDLTEYRLGSLTLELGLEEPNERDETVARRVQNADLQSKAMNDKTGQLSIVNRFSLRGKNGKTLELEDISPEDFTIIYDPVSSLNYASPEKRYCFTSKSLSKPMGILVMLHELGHCQDYELLNADEKEVYDSATSYKSEDQSKERRTQRAAALLMRERNAWAFALQKLRPLIPQDEENFWFNRKLMQSHVDSKLAGYSQGVIRRRIK